MAIKPYSSNSRYAPIWDNLKREAALNLTEGRGRVIVELNMPARTLRKAISKRKLEDNAFNRAFPSAKLEMVETSSGRCKQMVITLHLNKPLTPDMFQEDSCNE